ncbi:fumarylacetoacetase [Novosphingobium sp. 9]|uniref:fumarylacetoacetase n=1 Tax=Novosphingobium sp. 9 TaxID=2025349 RepID=UPI0021B5AD82|nr:fumarylacetoacetase [Novosphingobium sp. 9]
MTLPLRDATHDPKRTSWVASANGHAQFPVQNLPLGVYAPPAGPPRIGVAIGAAVLDLAACAVADLLPAAAQDAACQDTLNAIFALPARERQALRHSISALLSDLSYREMVEPLLTPAADCTMHLPARIGDYTDFYVGIHHAEAVGRLFRPQNPLLPNYKHLPIGYHGRASSVRVSGEPVIRPRGLVLPAGADVPTYAPTARLDHEVELALWVGPGNAPGQPIPIAEAAQHVVGVGLLNDWSARDIQAFEYQPLGPFLGKSFHTSVSPWVVTLEALAPFLTAQTPRPEGDPAPPPHLHDEEDARRGALALTLEANLTSERMRRHGDVPLRLSRASAGAMYWTMAQMIAHHTSNGCDLRPGDLLGTGTISGPDEGGCGSLLEMTRGGIDLLTLPSGETRAFLEDGDEVVLSARAQAPGAVPIGLGECRARVLPAFDAQGSAGTRQGASSPV